MCCIQVDPKFEKGVDQQSMDEARIQLDVSWMPLLGNSVLSSEISLSSLEKKKQETQALNSQIHPSVCVAGVDAAVTAIAGATAGSSISGKDEQMAKPEVAAAATLADALYMQLLK
uniref:VAN3-binding protein-like auxin canalisation domain-containing protein n=1 Tax=Brassica campestris TaxID=3711 RepID=M4EWW6_BRACM